MDYKGLVAHFKANPPIEPNGWRNRGSTMHDEFWRGFDGAKSLSAAGGPGRAAWEAGCEYAQIIWDENEHCA